MMYKYIPAMDVLAGLAAILWVALMVVQLTSPPTEAEELRYLEKRQQHMLISHPGSELPRGAAVQPCVDFAVDN